MKEPYPFEPFWCLRLDNQVIGGCGLLPKHLFPDRDRIEEFIVGSVRVRPKRGQLFLDSRQVNQLPPSKLLWYRTMQLQIGTHDHNTGSPDCVWYGVGLEHEQTRVGYRILSDGKLIEGLG